MEEETFLFLEPRMLRCGLTYPNLSLLTLLPQHKVAICKKFLESEEKITLQKFANRYHLSILSLQKWLDKYRKNEVFHSINNAIDDDGKEYIRAKVVENASEKKAIFIKTLLKRSMMCTEKQEKKEISILLLLN